jgi:ADP-heptose:LPS heptosyltransferase
MTEPKIKTIIISRTDSIGDVVLTLPVAHVLKDKFPGCKIIFLCRSYTKPVIECCANIDEIISWDEIEKQDPQKQLDIFRSLRADSIIHVFPNKKVAALAKKSGIPTRIGTSHRLFHWFTCNKLPNFTRKNSELHEAQLNFKLLAPLDIEGSYSLQEIRSFFDFTKIKPLSSELNNLIDKSKFNLILHPKSRGSAQEWGIANFSELVKILPKDKFQIFITGTKEEGDLIGNVFAGNDYVVNMTGKLSLTELISFVNHCEGLVAASTGPLHLAAILGKKAVGIYACVRPIHPGRWAPVGQNVRIVEAENVSMVKPESVAKVLMNF